MPRHQYVGDDERVYPGPPALVVGPGDVVAAIGHLDPSRLLPVPEQPGASREPGPMSGRPSPGSSR